jgi:Protein of unknown function (DUF1203)
VGLRAVARAQRSEGVSGFSGGEPAVLQLPCLFRVRKRRDEFSQPTYRFKMDVKLSYPFRVSGIPASVIDEFRNLPDRELTERRVKRIVADRKPGFPCRISLQDADAGETVYLLNFEHLPGNSPYRSVGPIFAREIATETYARINEIPEVLRVPGRVFSVRAYDNKDMLVAAEVANNGEIDQAIQRKLADKWVTYLHIHNAGPGCYSCRIDRA